jgi:signal transduction histidine kinase
MLRRAFLNLVDNAIKYAPEETKVTVRFYQNAADQRIVEVEDAGPGIPDQEKEHIFDRFYRIDNGRTREKGGTGLGLSITTASVEAHGGVVNIHDAPAGATGARSLIPAPSTHGITTP